MDRIEQKNPKKNSDFSFKTKITNIAILVLIPLIIGFVLYLIVQREEFFEVPLVVFGLIELLIVVRRFNKNDKKNLEKRGTYKNDKASVDYVAYKFTQMVLIYSALINFAISVLVLILLGE